MEQEFQSQLLERAVTELSRLPGIGRRTALRLSLHLLRQEPGVANDLGESIIAMRKGISYCKICHNISEHPVCSICNDPLRDASTICVVESVKDVLSMENTRRYNGRYHVLGGIISPMDGIGPQHLEIESLVDRATAGDIREVILALGATMEGDTTCYYIYKRIMAAAPDVAVTQLARGVSVGNDIEYTDEVTLGSSLVNRTPFGSVQR